MPKYVWITRLWHLYHLQYSIQINSVYLLYGLQSMQHNYKITKLFNKTCNTQATNSVNIYTVAKIHDEFLEKNTQTRTLYIYKSIFDIFDSSSQMSITCCFLTFLKWTTPLLVLLSTDYCFLLLFDSTMVAHSEWTSIITNNII